jgi:hypothetical protein
MPEREAPPAGHRFRSAPVRAGWGEAAQALVEAADDAPVWPDFANDGDESLRW